MTTPPELSFSFKTTPSIRLELVRDVRAAPRWYVVEELHRAWRHHLAQYGLERLADQDYSLSQMAKRGLYTITERNERLHEVHEIRIDDGIRYVDRLPEGTRYSQ